MGEGTRRCAGREGRCAGMRRWSRGDLKAWEATRIPETAAPRLGFAQGERWSGSCQIRDGFFLSTY